MNALGGINCNSLGHSTFLVIMERLLKLPSSVLIEIIIIFFPFKRLKRKAFRTCCLFYQIVSKNLFSKNKQANSPYFLLLLSSLSLLILL